MSEPFPDPTMAGTPQLPIQEPIPHALFKRTWLLVMGVILLVLAAIIAFQIFD
jgi:hypothetical protein